MNQVVSYTIKVAIFIAIGNLSLMAILHNGRRSETKNVITDGAIEIKGTVNAASSNVETKRILFWGQPTLASVYMENVGEETQDKICSYQCEFTTDRTLFDSSDAVIFAVYNETMHSDMIRSEKNVTLTRSGKQYWIFYQLESPNHAKVDESRDMFNLTMTYRLDSDIYIPYSRLLKIHSEESKAVTRNQDILENKTRLVAWIVSNCHGISRKKVVKELRKYITVDKFGNCGKYKCPAKDIKQRSCYRKIGGSYKFYLAFENSVCMDYVTEKFFNALDAGMVPVVYGGADYTHHAPEGSFINVNSFTSIKELAEYLLMLDKNPSEYLKYFEWRKRFKVDNISTLPRAWCNLCERLTKGNLPKRKVIKDLKSWWNSYENVSVCK